MTKYCKDCKYYNPGILNWKAWLGFGECHAPQNKSVNPVNGKPQLRVRFVDVQRELYKGIKVPGYCNDGDWFEPK